MPVAAFQRGLQIVAAHIEPIEPRPPAWRWRRAIAGSRGGLRLLVANKLANNGLPDDFRPVVKFRSAASSMRCASLFGNMIVTRWPYFSGRNFFLAGIEVAPVC
jgi:hypothetical protein